MSALPVLLLGFLLGIKHASETDHLAAVATLVTRQCSLRTTVTQGVAWGIGHGATLALIGSLVLALGRSLPARFAYGLEFAVGLMLIALGTDVLRRLRSRPLHIHVHRHGGTVHLHAHHHERGNNHDSAYEPEEHQHLHPSGTLRAFAVGMMHGMAGSAALIVLALGAVHSWVLGLIYIVIFGAGSVIGMALLSVVVALPLRLTAQAAGQWSRALTACVGLFSCGLGVLMVYRIGIAGGLLLP